MANYIQRAGMVLLALIPASDTLATSVPMHLRPAYRKIDHPEYGLPLNFEFNDLQHTMPVPRQISIPARRYDELKKAPALTPEEENKRDKAYRLEKR